MRINVPLQGLQKGNCHAPSFATLLCRQDIKLKVYDFQFEGDNKVHTKWRFSCILNLPWKPLLAAAGGTTHVLDLERGQIVEHIEQWCAE
eukprot:scaffold29045_cov19-Tisochrysis_lutea.AAC.1